MIRSRRVLLCQGYVVALTACGRRIVVRRINAFLGYDMETVVHTRTIGRGISPAVFRTLRHCRCLPHTESTNTDYSHNEQPLTPRNPREFPAGQNQKECQTSSDIESMRMRNLSGWGSSKMAGVVLLAALFCWLRVSQATICNVKDFGAKGDGTSNDTDAFIKAFQTCTGKGQSCHR